MAVEICQGCGVETIMVKVTISYDMLEGKEQECQEYLINRMAPALSELGFQITDVWYTVWGNPPQILSGGEIDDMDDARRIFESEEWAEIAENIEPLTENFQVRFLNVDD